MFAKKKRVELVGSLEYPLAIGNGPYITAERNSDEQH